MFDKIKEQISQLTIDDISEERKLILNELVAYIKQKQSENNVIQLNFICTHNSRRSHLTQLWAQTMANYFGIKNVYCYSGGTEATAMFYKVAETLVEQGFQINKKDDTTNPVYEVYYDELASPILCFSKTFDDPFNPDTNFAAIMTCSSADEACPYIPGATKRIPIRYEDPKAYDNTPEMDAKYRERSLEIAREMKYVFGDC